jgi:signal transduction histidine kinase
MLVFDKIDENKLVLELGCVNPWTMIQEAMRPFQINAKKADVQLSYQILNSAERIDDSIRNFEDQFFINADKFKLNQVLRNLISNALKFTPPKREVKIVAEIKQNKKKIIQEANLSPFHIRISVIDTGYGISKENQLKLFGQYIQFNASALQQGKGSGLGLWIAKST